MGFKLKGKEDWSKLMKRSSITYRWEYTPIKNMADGWKKLFDVADAIESAADVESVLVRSKYVGEKEFRDLGEKILHSAKELRDAEKKIADDENYCGEIWVNVDGEPVSVMFYNSGELGDIEFTVDGSEKGAKFVSTVIKKALGE